MFIPHHHPPFDTALTLEARDGAFFWPPFDALVEHIPHDFRKTLGSASLEGCDFLVLTHKFGFQRDSMRNMVCWCSFLRLVRSEKQKSDLVSTV